MNKNTKKRNKRAIFLILYAVIIIALFLYIIFFAPEQFFQKQREVPQTTTKSLENMQEELLQNKYEYKMNILSRKETHYKCNGKREGEKEEGTCTSPQTLTYTETTKKEIFKEINSSFLEVDYLFRLIRDVEPKVEEYQANKIYTYNILLDNLNTDIVLITDKEHILEIRLNNLYEVYNFTYSSIMY